MERNKNPCWSHLTTTDFLSTATNYLMGCKDTETIGSARWSISSCPTSTKGIPHWAGHLQYELRLSVVLRTVPFLYHGLECFQVQRTTRNSFHWGRFCKMSGRRIASVVSSGRRPGIPQPAQNSGRFPHTCCSHFVRWCFQHPASRLSLLPTPGNYRRRRWWIHVSFSYFFLIPVSVWCWSRTADWMWLFGEKERRCLTTDSLHVKLL